ncbi:MAG: chorismate mutase [Hydrotalea sp.]|nr:chorismate mutase [Hydrotalea sp.]
MTINNIRAEIDKIDVAIAELLKKRWGAVAKISAFKKLARQEAGYRPFREQAIYNKLPNDEVVTRDEYWSIWKELMATTVMRENQFHIAVAKDFFADHGFGLAQEFGRQTKWRVDDAPLNLLTTRAVGLAVVPVTAVDDILAAGDKLAVVNIFPSFIFYKTDDNKNIAQKISNQDVKGVIVAWQQMEEVDPAMARLAVVARDDKKRFDVIDEAHHKQPGGRVIGIVPRPAYWQD